MVKKLYCRVGDIMKILVKDWKSLNDRELKEIENAVKRVWRCGNVTGNN